jgi:hypothetical protein
MALRVSHPFLFRGSILQVTPSYWQFVHGVPEVAKLHRTFLKRQFWHATPDLGFDSRICCVISTVSWFCGEEEQLLVKFESIQFNNLWTSKRRFQSNKASECIT